MNTRDTMRGFKVSAAAATDAILARCRAVVSLEHARRFDLLTGVARSPRRSRRGDTTVRDELAGDIAAGLRNTDSTMDSALGVPRPDAAETHRTFDFRGVADFLLERGWHKVDPTAETRTEWGVSRSTEHFGTCVHKVDSEDAARRQLSSFLGQFPDAVVVSRIHTASPWVETSRNRPGQLSEAPLTKGVVSSKFDGGVAL